MSKVTKEKKNVTDGKIQRNYINDCFDIICCEDFENYPHYPDLMDDDFYKRINQYIDAGLYDPANASGKFKNNIKNARKSSKNKQSNIDNKVNNTTTVNDDKECDKKDIAGLYNTFKKETNSKNLFDVILFGLQNMDLISEEINDAISKKSINNDNTNNDENITDNNSTESSNEEITESYELENNDKKDTVSLFSDLFPSRKTLTTRATKKYLVNDLMNTVLKHVDPNYKTLIHKCRKDISRILKDALNNKNLEQYINNIVDSSNSLLSNILDLETNSIINNIDSLSTHNGRKNPLEDETKDYISTVVTNIKSGSDKEIIKLIDLIVYQLGKFGLFDDLVKLCIDCAGQFHRIDNPVLYDNINDDQVLEFINTYADHILTELSNITDEDAAELNTIKVEIDRAINELNSIITNIGNMSSLSKENDNEVIVIPPEQVQVEQLQKPVEEKKPKIKALFTIDNDVLLSETLSAEIPEQQDVNIQGYNPNLGNIVEYNNLSTRRKHDISYIKNTISKVLDYNIWIKEIKVYALEDNLYAVEIKKRHHKQSIIYKIDIGTVVGHGRYLVYDINYLPLDQENILRRFLNRPDNIEFQLTKEEKDICDSYLFDKQLYNYIDMYYVDNNDNMKIMELSNEEYLELGNTLSTILQKAKSKRKSINYRFRFEVFNSIDSFTLVSDDKVKIVTDTPIDTKISPKVARVIYNKSVDSDGKENKLVTIQYGNNKSVTSFSL